MRNFIFALIGIITTINPVFATNQAQIDAILKENNPPFGVVFEILEGSGNALEWAMPRIKKYSERLRRRHPDIGIAVVSHGQEQFALTKENNKEFKEVHKVVQSLVDQEIPVHVCGTYASWHDKLPEDFPDYVSVAPAGPTEIKNYEEMGYELVVMEKEI